MTKVSDKYQVVIPKKVREKLKLRKGDRLHVYSFEDKLVLSKNKKWPDDYLGSQSEFWKGIDIAEYLKEERDSWDR